MITMVEKTLKKIAAGVFKTNCLSLMDELQMKREPMIITKRGKPVAKIVPVEKDTDEIFGFLKDRITIVDDVIKPVIPVTEWDRLK